MMSRISGGMEGMGGTEEMMGGDEDEEGVCG
jgi:hypothetical protein